MKEFFLFVGRRKKERIFIKKDRGDAMITTIKGYTNNPELRKKEVIPGTFDRKGKRFRPCALAHKFLRI